MSSLRPARVRTARWCGGEVSVRRLIFCIWRCFMALAVCRCVQIPAILAHIGHCPHAPGTVDIALPIGVA